MAKQELNIEIRNSKQIQMIEKQKIQNARFGFGI